MKLRAVLFGFLIGFCGSSLFADEVLNQRAIWVTRWDFKTPEDVKTILKNAHYVGANQVFFQIRGNGSAFYNSAIEPWAWELTGDDPSTLGQHPGWDPLTVALHEAEALHLQLHGWINVFPGWRGTQPPPAQTGQLWRAHRDWFIIDHNGDRLKPRDGFYAFLSPGHPEARKYLARLFGELAQNYPGLHGLHMDYVRYPANHELRQYRNFSFDAPSVQAFKNIHGHFPAHRSDKWAAFKRDQVTQSIRLIRQAMKQHNPKMQLSATCITETEKARNEAGQEPVVWLNENLVDWVVPMTYTQDLNTYRGKLEELLQRFGPQRKDKLVLGLNADFNTPWGLSKQIEEAQTGQWAGEALFAYSSLFSNHRPNQKAEVVRKLWLEEQIQEALLSTMANE